MKKRNKIFHMFLSLILTALMAVQVIEPGFVFAENLPADPVVLDSEELPADPVILDSEERPSDQVSNASEENTPEVPEHVFSPEVALSYSVFNQEATIQISLSGDERPVKVLYLRGKYVNVNHKNWDKKAGDVTGQSSVNVDKEGFYSFLFIDEDGCRIIKRIKVNMEFRAYWYAFFDYTPGQTEAQFRASFRKVCKNAVSQGMNAIAAHVRMFSDAMYKSSYYPWSKYASGTQGKDPGYDPLEIMIELAHKYDLELHAWLNPYRVAKNSTNIDILSDDNPAKIWLTDDDKKNDRNVLIFSGNIYLNPARSEVRKLIVNGIKEIVENYDVDGIHFDDYFYPEYLGPEYKTIFDAKEYKSYVRKTESKSEEPLDIVSWRRENVNKLLRTIYSSIKEINPKVVFGVSPGGYLDHLTKVDRNYVDYPTWLSSNEYMDYICPQVYWSNSSSNTFPYNSTVNRWINARTEDCKVKIYIGIAVYKCGITSEKGWTKTNILKRMILSARATGKVDGFMFFDYRDMINSDKKKYVNPMVELFVQ